MTSDRTGTRGRPAASGTPSTTAPSSSPSRPRAAATATPSVRLLLGVRQATQVGSLKREVYANKRAWIIILTVDRNLRMAILKGTGDKSPTNDHQDQDEE